MELDKRKNDNKVETIDLMDGLIQIEDDEGDKLSDKEVVDNIVSLVAAGYMSTSLASTWAIYLLAKYPIVLQKLRVLLNLCLIIIILNCGFATTLQQQLPLHWLY